MNKTDTLEADAPAVPQEPVAWIEHHKGGDNLNWQQCEASDTPLFRAPQPQQPRLTDEEIDALWGDEPLSLSQQATRHVIARMVEKKVRGEA